ncbi:hypothetical protein KUCAC02_014300 [Chaenocephalus aceratus]|uniref:Uncharacterized protein n=1 Tax=Chaenocephalus aceratus TaxID=36190 RepID=A0ACB9WDD1_CHAAC|nr:hypothetical protein KUCAC02_014300 [Chaenocephalus aceratus]
MKRLTLHRVIHFPPGPFTCPGSDAGQGFRWLLEAAICTLFLNRATSSEMFLILIMKPGHSDAADAVVFSVSTVEEDEG